MINEFLQYLQYEKNYSFHTVLSYNRDLSQFCEFLNTDIHQFKPQDIEAQHIQQWVLTLVNEKNVSKTLSRKISTLKSFWKFMLLRGYTNHNPTLRILLPKIAKSIPAFFNENEMDAALDETFLTNDFESLRNHLIIELFYLTGIRLSELLNIKDSDLDFSNKNLSVIGKRNKQRIIPLGDSIIEKVRNYIIVRDNNIDGVAEMLFVRQNGLKLYPKFVYNIVHNTMQEFSGLHQKSPHVLRHTFATSLLNGGADINVLKELLGHSSLAATQIYTHSSFEELYNIYKQAHPRAK